MFNSIAGLLLAVPSPFLAPCGPNEAEPATIEQIVAAGEAWLQQCVTVSGRTSGRILSTTADRAPAIGLDNGEVLGIDFRMEDDVPVTVTGRIDSCERRGRAIQEEQRRNPDVVILHAGFCHYRGGIVLVASRGHRRR